jgi:hypothetical protein
MSINHNLRRNAAAAFAVGTLGIVAAFSAGPAYADAVDDTFVASLADAGIPQIDPAREIAAGQAVCQNLSEGPPPDEIVSAFVAKNVFATRAQDVAMIRASITAYCPQYLPQLHS